MEVEEPSYLNKVEGASGDETPDGIRLEDLYELLNLTPKTDSDTEEFVQKHRIFMYQHKLKRLNAVIEEVREIWKQSTPVQLYVAFDMSNCNTDDLMTNLLEPGFKAKVVEETDKRLSRAAPVEPAQTAFVNNYIVSEKETQEDTDMEIEGEEDYDELPQQPIKVVKHKKHQRHKAPPISSIPRCPNTVDQDTWFSWSEARRNSYMKERESPNSYYYRHLPQGEVQRNGPWTEQEKRLFIERYNQMQGDDGSVHGQWGLFSLAIPGRVGYQCSNFYRKLISTGEIKDRSYVFDSYGKLHHTSRSGDGYKKRGGEKKVPPAPPVLTSIELFRSSTEPIRPKPLSLYEQWAVDNPIPNAIDSITNETIKVPAISPDGYVLDYNTWINLLKTSKENPYTRQPISKRQLIILNSDNIHKYENRIVNLDLSAM